MIKTEPNQKYIEAVNSGDASDYLQLGIYYYRTARESGPTVLRERTAQYVSKADSAFARVIELAPDSYQGYYWRANANTLSDPDLSKGLANDDYLKTVEILETNDDKEKLMYLCTD